MSESDSSVHVIIVFFFFVNYCISTGFLSIPYTMVTGGYLLALPTLIIITIATWVGSNYVLEVMARAQIYRRSQEELQNRNMDGENEDPSNLTGDKDVEVLKTEIIELCSIFFHRYAKYAYFVAQTVSLFTGMWADAIVAGTAWAITIPFHYIHSSLTCSDSAFFHRFLPSDGCLYSYYLSLALYACIVISLSLLDLEKQAIFQIIFGILRFMSLFLIVMYCVVHLVQGGDPCLDYDDANGNVTIIRNLDYTSVVVKFDVKGWVQSIPIYSFVYIFLTTIPSLLYPIRKKEMVHWLMLAVVVSVLLSYLLIGISVSLWFRAATQEKCTLNWAVYTDSPHPMPLRVMSYYIILFPSLNVVSSFPLGVHVLVNGVHFILTGKDTSERTNDRCNKLTRLFLRLITAFLSFVGAFITSNLGRILSISGMITLVILITPFLLQICSIYKLKKCLLELGIYQEKSPESKIGIASVTKRSLEEHTRLTGESYSTRTIYSFPVISRSTTASILMLFGISLYAALIANFFIPQNNLSCHVLEINDTVIT